MVEIERDKTWIRGLSQTTTTANPINSVSCLFLKTLALAGNGKPFFSDLQSMYVQLVDIVSRLLVLTPSSLGFTGLAHH